MVDLLCTETHTHIYAHAHFSQSMCDHSFTLDFWSFAAQAVLSSRISTLASAMVPVTGISDALGKRAESRYFFGK